MAGINLNTVPAQLEAVRPILAQLYDTSDEVVNMLMKGSKETVTNISRYLYRIPLQLYRGGTFAKYSAAGGSIPRGTGMKLSSLQAGYIYSILMFEVLDEAQDLSKNPKQSVVDVMAKTLADAMDVARVHNNIHFFQDGTGALTNASSACPSSTTLTFAATTDRVDVRRLMPGMVVDLWTVTGAAGVIRANGPYTIDAVDYVNKTVTFLTAPTSMASGDLIVVANVDEYGPAYPISFTAGWPATSALTTEAGLTNDSFRHGLYYSHNPTISNYYLGQLKSTIPQLQPVFINAAGSASLAHAHGLQIKDKIVQARDESVLKGLRGIFPMSQRAQAVEIGTTIVNRVITGDQVGNIIDLMPKNTGYGDQFTFCDIPCIVSKRAETNRVDFVNPANWTRVEVFPLRPYEKNGRTVFEGRDTNGQLAAYSQFGFQEASDFACLDPGAEAFIYNLVVPENY